jgi:hypothetical protein
MSPEAFAHDAATALFLGLTAASAWAARQNHKRQQAADILRGRALEICDRLRDEGRGLKGATREELIKIRDALKS